ncbi:hypothetical protein [Okeania sp. KiyG1]|uniref:hypothetical protein n=1 Tax=Okeania sp. KiyG1 TaxID=2720165 RepID=UPI001922BC0E|nr:hypothetical protein [Okeania sp. KiyG1]
MKLFYRCYAPKVLSIRHLQKRGNRQQATHPQPLRGDRANSLSREKKEVGEWGVGEWGSRGVGSGGVKSIHRHA